MHFNFYKFKSTHESFFKLTFSELQKFNCKKMKIFVALATIAVIFVLTAAAPRYENKLASRKAEIRSALEEALIQSDLEEDVASLQSISAEVEQDSDNDELNKAHLMKFIAQMQSPKPNAHAQWGFRYTLKGLKGPLSG